MDESFKDITMLAEREIMVKGARVPATLTSLMDRDIGYLAEVGVWDTAIT